MACVTALLALFAIASLFVRSPESFWPLTFMALMLAAGLWVEYGHVSHHDADTLEIVRSLLTDQENTGTVTAPPGGILLRPRHEHFDNGTPAS